MKKIFSIVLFSALVLGLNGCKDYMDINSDPNSPASENLTSDMILSAAEMNIAATYSYTLHVLGAYNVEYYAQQFGTPNYVKYSQFEVSATNGSGIYTQLFQRALGNLNTVKQRATDNGENGVLLQVAVLRAFAYQLLVDAFGEVPYKEAFQPSILTPHYDKGQDIYEGLIKEINDALAAVKAGDAVAKSFIIPSQSLDEWIRFANGQKLRMLVRMSDVKDVKADVEAIVAENKLPEGDVKIAGCWANASGQANPLFSEELATWGRATNNMIGNVALIQTMQDGGVDGRLAKLFKKNKTGVFQGGLSGSNLSTVDEPYNSSDAFGGIVVAYNTPVILLGKTEVEFFLAEFFARQNDAGQAKAHYDAAIEASFATAGAEGAAEAIALRPYNHANWKECIGVSKWIALAGINGFEGYTEARRLDYPEFGNISGTDMYPLGKGAIDFGLYVAGKLYTPFDVFSKVGNNHLLERFPYPESSTSRNSNAPAFPGHLEPIFWGK